MAEAAKSHRLVAAMTEVQGDMSELIALIAHPEEVLAQSNVQHARLIKLLEAGHSTGAAELVRKHLEGTEHILIGLMPSAT
jgi:DNA-binding GntR family transcriptional regulator